MARATNDPNKNEKHADDIDLADSCLAKVLENDKVAVLNESDWVTNKNLSQSISKPNLITEQHKDREISTLFQKAVKESELSKNPVCYFVKKDILMRKWRPPDVSVDDEWAVKYQIVIPKVYRYEIFSLAHETPLAGQSGSKKTLRIPFYPRRSINYVKTQSLNDQVFVPHVGKFTTVTVYDYNTKIKDVYSKEDDNFHCKRICYSRVCLWH